VPVPTPSPTPTLTSTSTSPLGCFVTILQAVFPIPAAVGQATDVAVGFRDTAAGIAGDTTVRIAVLDVSGTEVAQRFWAGQSLVPQQLVSESLVWQSTGVGTCTVQSDVTDSTGATLAPATGLGSFIVQ
jgi:hypothetical protein